jgi:hypothetical protein
LPERKKEKDGENAYVGVAIAIRSSVALVFFSDARSAAGPETAAALLARVGVGVDVTSWVTLDASRGSVFQASGMLSSERQKGREERKTHGNRRARFDGIQDASSGTGGFGQECTVVQIVEAMRVRSAVIDVSGRDAARVSVRRAQAARSTTSGRADRETYRQTKLPGTGSTGSDPRGGMRKLYPLLVEGQESTAG